MHKGRIFLTSILFSAFALGAVACGQDTLHSFEDNGELPLPDPIPLPEPGGDPVVGETLTLTAEAQGHPGCDGCEPFEWQITAPSGAVVELAGAEVDVLVDEPGTWQAEVTVHYLHEVSAGVLYGAHASLAFDAAGDSMPGDGLP